MLFLIPRNHLFSKVQNRLFLWTVVLNIFMMLVTMSDFALSFAEFENAWLFRRITSYFNFALAPVLPLMLFRIFVQGKRQLLHYAPLLVNIMICTVSLFTNVVFLIRKDNKYFSGPLVSVPAVIALFYVFMLAWYPAKEKRKNKKAERVLCLATIFFLTLTMVLEAFEGMVLLNYGVCAISLCVFYLMQNINYFNTDPLTGAYNRQMYQHTLGRIANHKSSVLAFIDINEFKDINDTYGHEEGDKMLKDFVRILGEHTNSVADLYRIGGDEFMLIATKADKSQVRKAVENAQQACLVEKISFAFGMEVYHSQQDLQEVLRAVDQDMYKVKAKMKTSTKD